MKTGAELIAEERQRQIEVKNWQNDDSYVNEELVMAGVSYALAERHRDFNPRSVIPPVGWPWMNEVWKPTPKNRIKELAKAGALIAAEIDRLQRIEKPENA